MQTFKQYLIEGGGAIANVIRITKNDVPATLHNINQQILSKLKLQWAPIGSAGTKETSGDIDIAISGEIIDLDQLLLKVEPLLPAECEIRALKGINVLSFSFPIANNDGKVQVDLMPTENIDFAKFAYGRERNANLLINKISTIILPHTQVDKPDGRYETRFFFSPLTGLTLGVKFYKRNKENFNNGKYISRKVLTDPNLIIKILFGPQATITDLVTIDSIKHLVNTDASYMNIDITSFPDITKASGFSKYSKEQIVIINSFIAQGVF